MNSSAFKCALALSGLVLAATSCTRNSRTESAPDLSFLPELVDVGLMQPDQEIHVDFVALNRSDVPLYIDEVTASCGCTKPVLESNVVAPGGTASIGVDTKSPAAMGVFQRQVMLKAVGHAFVMTISGRVVHAVEVHPRELRVNRAQPTQGASCYLECLSGKSLKVRSINAEDGFAVRHEVVSGRKHKLTIVAEPAVALGRHKPIEVVFDAPECAPIVIPLSVHEPLAPRITPNRCRLDFDSQQQIKNVFFKIDRAASGVDQVYLREDDDPGIKLLSFSQTLDAGGTELECEFGCADLPEEVYESDLVIVFDDGQSASVPILVTK